MLAQNFKTPAELGIADMEFGALVKVLGMLEREEIESSHFDMEIFQDQCGTIGCICGWCYFVSHGEAFPEVGNERHDRAEPLLKRLPLQLQQLFYIKTGFTDAPIWKATTSQAAIAVRNYLTFGEPRWAEALAE